MPDEIENLSPLEQAYRQKLLDVFSLVNPGKPEKGILPLLKRARALAEHAGIPYDCALEEIYRGAVERTERRVKLLRSCPLRQADENQP